LNLTSLITFNFVLTGPKEFLVNSLDGLGVRFSLLFKSSSKPNGGYLPMTLGCSSQYSVIGANDTRFFMSTFDLALFT